MIPKIPHFLLFGTIKHFLHKKRNISVEEQRIDLTKPHLPLMDVMMSFIDQDETCRRHNVLQSIATNKHKHAFLYLCVFKFVGHG